MNLCDGTPKGTTADGDVRGGRTCRRQRRRRQEPLSNRRSTDTTEDVTSTTTAATTAGTGEQQKVDGHDVGRDVDDDSGRNRLNGGRSATTPATTTGTDKQEPVNSPTTSWRYSAVARHVQRYKRLCYCRGTARRATSVEILWPFFD